MADEHWCPTCMRLVTPTVPFIESAPRCPGCLGWDFVSPRLVRAIGAAALEDAADRLEREIAEWDEIGFGMGEDEPPRKEASSWMRARAEGMRLGVGDGGGS
jgi:hypothetical protein